MNKYFKSKKPSSIETSFIRQCDENNSASTENIELSPQRENELLNKIKVLQVEKDHIRKKYEKLKDKHVQLLQTLLHLEEKNQKLGNCIQEFKTSQINTMPFEKAVGVDVLSDLVSIASQNFFFQHYVFTFSNFKFC